MEIVETRNREAIEAFLRRDAATHVYPIGDLDDFFWPDTTWYASYEHGEIRALVLILDTLDPPILYAIDPSGTGALRELLDEIRDRLPRCVFATFSPELEDWFRAHGSFQPHGLHDKMKLMTPKTAARIDIAAAERLAPENLAELQSFLAGDAYLREERVARFFEPYMLEQGPYFGIREKGKLVSVGGTHIHSPELGVAALGNLATRPDHRRQGHARTITAAVIQSLDGIQDIGLNVQRSNRAAIRGYVTMGFQRICSYIEATVTK